MTDKKIYSFKAHGGGARVSGRVCATDMNDATHQVTEIVAGYGPMAVNVSELRNQNRAMQQWIAKHGEK